VSGSGETGVEAPKPQIPALEWIAAGIGLAMTLGMFGVIGWGALKGNGERPPAVEAIVEHITPVAAGYVVEVALRNHSPSTAAAVEIEGELKNDGTSVETSNATVDYVPGESVRRAGIFFTKDPARHELEVRALGYAEP
jgi:uncharacterized protein (TIGR02588 family)